jgi:hypothetical protein
MTPEDREAGRRGFLAAANRDKLEEGIRCEGRPEFSRFFRP